QTGATAPVPNSVQVTVRRDANVTPGPVRLIFGSFFGVPTSSRQATATGTLRSNVTGFKGSGSKLLPLAMSLDTFNTLKGVTTLPLGVVSQDSYTVKLPLDTGATPPANVVHGGDG